MPPNSCRSHSGRPADGKSPLFPHRSTSGTGRAVPKRGRRSPWDPSLVARPHRPGSSCPRVDSAPSGDGAAEEKRFLKGGPGPGSGKGCGVRLLPGPAPRLSPTRELAESHAGTPRVPCHTLPLPPPEPRTHSRRAPRARTAHLSAARTEGLARRNPHRHRSAPAHGPRRGCTCRRAPRPGTPRPLPFAPRPRTPWRVVPAVPRRASGSCDVPEAAGERPAAPGARAEAAADLLAEPRAVWPPQPGGRPGLFITGRRTQSFPLPLRRP